MAGQVHVRVTGEDGDPERLEQATLSLRTELLDLVGDVQQVRDAEAPPGTRAMDVATIGALLVTVASGLEPLRQVVSTVREWLGRSRGQFTAELVIGGDRLTVTGISQTTQESLIDVWLRGHAFDRMGGVEDRDRPTRLDSRQ
jgi:hypothetical protein